MGNIDLPLQQASGALSAAAVHLFAPATGLVTKRDM
jgi:hypothetical protein